MKAGIDKEDKLVMTLADVMHLFRRSKKTLLYWSAAFALFGMIFALTRPIRYEADGTFREKGLKTNNVSTSSVVQLLSGSPLSGTESEAASLFISRRILCDVVEKLNLQADLKAISDLETPSKLISRNLNLTWASLLRGSAQPVLDELCCTLKVTNLNYSGEIPRAFHIHLLSEGHYEMREGKEVFQGKLGETFKNGELTFTLVAADPKAVLSPQYFTFTVKPLYSAVRDLFRSMKVEPSKVDKTLLKIKCEHRDRHLACQILNTMMQSYQDYLKNTHAEIAFNQLEYLNQRRDQLGDKLSNAMQRHAEWITDDLSNSGFLEASKEIDFLATSQREYKQKMLDNELEIKRLTNIQPSSLAHYHRYSPNEGDPTHINTILAEMRTLKQQRDGLKIELQKTAQHHLSEEFKGISLEVATNLYLDYSKQLVQIEANIRQNLFFIHQLEDPSFEITSLSAGLEDEISKNIIHQANDLVLNLKDQNNQSLKEQERIKNELDLQRTFLMMHLNQMVKLMELNQEVISEKISALENASLALVHERIFLLEKSLQDYFTSRLQNLQQERTLIQRHLDNIQSEMAALPQKWVSEQLLKQEIETNHKIVEEIAKLVESKNISHNLDVIQSSPVDAAIVPLHPIAPNTLLWGLLGFFMGGILGSGYLLGKTLKNGMKATESNLSLLGFYFAGNLNDSTHTLRRLLTFVERDAQKGKTVLLIESDGPHYASELADLLLKRGKKVVTLDLNFNDPSKIAAPGLLQYLEGKIQHLPIRKGRHGDWIGAGGATPYAVELIQTEAFHRLFDELEQQYDWILAVTTQCPTSGEAESLAASFPYTAITLAEETIDQLGAYMALQELHPENSIIFLQS